MKDTATEPTGPSRRYQFGGSLFLLGAVVAGVATAMDWGSWAYLVATVHAVVGAAILGAELRRRSA